MRNRNLQLRRMRFLPFTEPLEQRRVLSTIQVTSPIDLPQKMNGGSNPVDTGGLVSLRSAIQAANASSGPNISNTIDLPAGTYTLSVVPTELQINGNLTIQGAGAATTIINANSLDRVFDILGGTVTISGVTIEGGMASMGAGVLNNGANLTLSNDVISGNHAVGYTGENGFAGTSAAMTGDAGAVGGAGYGGGVDNASGTLSIVDSSIMSNSATGGAGGIGGEGVRSTGATGDTEGGNVSPTVPRWAAETCPLTGGTRPVTTATPVGQEEWVSGAVCTTP